MPIAASQLYGSAD